MTLALQQFLDALPEHCAILDRHGLILRVNAAWQTFAAQNAAVPAAACGIGANYFAVCENAHQAGDTLATRTPLSPYSTAATRVRCITAALPAA